MEKIQNVTSTERGAYSKTECVRVFDSAMQGEGALSDCMIVECENVVFSAPEPLWRDCSVTLADCELTADAKNAIWYADSAELVRTEVEGDRACRECSDLVMRESNARSDEFGWYTDGARLTDGAIKGEQPLLRSRRLALRRMELAGRYALQYACDSILIDCKINSMDALWHTNKVTLENCVLVGERPGWYSKNLTLKGCTIIGSRPLCFCKNLHLENCILVKASGAFERSEVYAVLRDDIEEIRDPYKGVIRAPSAGKYSLDERFSRCKIMFDPTLKRKEKNVDPF